MSLSVGSISISSDGTFSATGLAGALFEPKAQAFNASFDATLATHATSLAWYTTPMRLAARLAALEAMKAECEGQAAALVPMMNAAFESAGP